MFLQLTRSVQGDFPKFVLIGRFPLCFQAGWHPLLVGAFMFSHTLPQIGWHPFLQAVYGFTPCSCIDILTPQLLQGVCINVFSHVDTPSAGCVCISFHPPSHTPSFNLADAPLFRLCVYILTICPLSCGFSLASNLADTPYCRVCIYFHRLTPPSTTGCVYMGQFPQDGENVCFTGIFF